MVRIWPLLLISVLLAGGTGCDRGAKLSPLPSDEVLVELLYDLHLAEATLSRVPFQVQDSIALLVRERVAASYQITPEQMDDWLFQLQMTPEHLITVYDSLIVLIERRQKPHDPRPER